MANFFITGLNRSRTSWLTLLMRHGPVYCRHEWMSECESLLDLTIRMADRPEAYVGNSDASLLSMVSEVRQFGPVVLIRRNPAHGAVSFSKLGIRTSFDELTQWDRWMREAEEVADLVVDFHQLDTELVARKVWQTCVPEVEFPTEHFRFIRQFNIQPSYHRISELTSRAKIAASHQ